MSALPRGFRVGHWTDPSGRTGCTVVLCDEGTVGGVDVRGAAPDTLRTDLLDPAATVMRVDAVLLTGGSAFGLAAADGVMRYLEQAGVGFRVGQFVVPIVVGAVIFDLAAAAGAPRPDANAGYVSASVASPAAPAEGRVGAGAGATIGKLFGQPRPGGVGFSSLAVGTATVSALFVVNALGDVVDDTARPIGWTGAAAESRLMSGELPPRLAARSTTIGVIATDAVISKREAALLARSGHDGIARAVRPSHLEMDGDTVFAVATAKAAKVDLAILQTAGAIAAADAIRRAILATLGHSGRG